MKLVTIEEYARMAAVEPQYYNRARWGYVKAVLELIGRLEVSSALELGPRHMPVVSDGDTMDMTREYLSDLTYQHDATQIPWPVEDKRYDLFIALQVWEHLQGHQKEAFGEVRRITRKAAILSFPFRWNCPQEPDHHNITEETIAEWTHFIQPRWVLQAGSRIVYLFDLSAKT